MSTEVAVIDYRTTPMDGRIQYARNIAGAVTLLPSGMRASTPDQTAANVFLQFETGDMLGLHPIAALAGINIIEGKPAASAALMSGVIRGAGHKLRISEEGTVEGGDYKATATLIRSDDPEAPFTSTWTPHRAARAGLCTYAKGDDGIWQVRARSGTKNAPLPWELYTESLCKARVVSEVARDGGQDVLFGIRYTPEELGVAVDAQGDVLTGEDAPVPAAEPEPVAKAALPPATKRATVGTQGTRRRKAADPDPAPAEETKAEAVPLVIADETGTHYVDTVTQEPMSEEDAKAARAKIDADREAEPGEPYDPAVDEAHLAPDVDRADPVAVAEYNADQAKGKTQAYLTSDDERERQAARLRGEVTEGEGETLTKAERDEKQRVADAALKARLAAERAARAAQAEADAEAEERAERERIAAEQAAQVQIAEGGPHPFDVAREEEPDNYARQISAATTAEQLKAIYDAAEAAKAMTSTLRMEIIKAKAHLAAPVAEEPTE